MKIWTVTDNIIGCETNTWAFSTKEKARAKFNSIIGGYIADLIADKDFDLANQWIRSCNVINEDYYEFDDEEIWITEVEVE